MLSQIDVVPEYVMRQLVHIVDDDHMARASLSFLLQANGVASEIYESGAEFFSRAVNAQGCILLDLRMPGMDGIMFQEEAIRRGCFLPVVMISAEGDFPAAVRAIKGGALDFLEKGAPEADLLTAVRGALSQFEQEEQYCGVQRVAAARLRELSPREVEVLNGICEGLSSKVIAQRLELSPRTVEMHRANVATKLDVHSVAEMVRLAMDGGLVSGRTATSRIN
jgi:two-component system response regulator FixJ